MWQTTGIRKMHTGCCGENLKARGPLGTPWPNWEDNGEINLKQIGWETVEWINLFEDKDMR
jgi:hypothetical protein